MGGSIPPADQREIFPRTIPVGSVGREDILYCDYRSGSDVRRMMRLFWLHQPHRSRAQRQNNPHRAQRSPNHQSLQKCLRKTAWDKREAGELGSTIFIYFYFFGDWPWVTGRQILPSNIQKWDEMRTMRRRLCLCSLMGLQDVLLRWWRNLQQVQRAGLQRGRSCIFNSKHLMGITGRMQIHVYARSSLFEQHIDRSD